MALYAWFALILARRASADGFFASVFKATFGIAEANEVVTAPVTLGLEIAGGLPNALIPYNATLPTSKSHVHEGKCPSDRQDLHVLILANPQTEKFQLGELKLPCVEGGQIKLEQTLEVTDKGRLMLSLEDLTGNHPAHTLQQTFPSYERLSDLLAPFRAELRTANATLAELRAALEAERTEAALLFSKFSEMEKDMEARGQDLWACLREASDSEQAAHLTTEQLMKEKEKRDAEVKDAMRAKSTSEAEAVQKRDELREKEAELNQLDSEVSRLTSELETLGKEHWSVMREATSLEEAKQSLADELRRTEGQASLWLGVAATAVVGLLGAMALQRQRSGEREEEAEGGSVKRERQRLLRLLARVRKVQEEPAEPAKAAEPSAGKTAKEESGGFSYTVVHEANATPPLQRIRVQCPAVQEADVSIQVIFNGAVVNIDRKESPGVEPFKWSQQFQFASEEGQFQFSDAETRLRYGVLELVFRAAEFHQRTFRFPEHFDMAYSDM